MIRAYNIEPASLIFILALACLVLVDSTIAGAKSSCIAPKPTDETQVTTNTHASGKCWPYESTCCYSKPTKHIDQSAHYSTLRIITEQFRVSKEKTEQHRENQSDKGKDRVRKIERERIMERIGMRGTDLENLSSFDFIITTEEAVSIFHIWWLCHFSCKRENQRIRIRIVLEVLSSVDHIITTSIKVQVIVCEWERIKEWVREIFVLSSVDHIITASTKVIVWVRERVWKGKVECVRFGDS